MDDSSSNQIRGVDESMPIDRRGWREMSMEAILLIPNLIKLFMRLMRDPRIPIRRKMLVGAVLVYVVSPIDLIPDFVVGFGKLDDIVVLSIAINHLTAGAEASIVEEHWDGSVDSLDLVLSVFRWGAEIVPGLDKVLPK
ncbi:MAG: YkvA family protein [Actinomycetia bacterium]|nr:YkvA family protein [Actinomycetes bacterium]